jgi:hypothetical protein
MDQVNAFGVYICAETTDLTFERATRPDSNNNCPDRLVKCSENTTRDTTICVPEDQEDSCPINDISFSADSAMDYAVQ